MNCSPSEPCHAAGCIFCDPAGVLDAHEVTTGCNLPDSWAPIDLGPYLRGEVDRPEPTCGIARSDGLHMLYPGKEHACIGEMESGKSWFALGCASAELAAGNPVVYIHFEECDPSDTVERLVALGVSDDLIIKLFRFVGPERQVSAAALAALLDPKPTLVVLDGVNEAMSLHKWGIREEDGAAEFRRCLVKPCTRVGSTVLSLDHVVKDAERRARTALGSVHKVNGLSGSLILLENAEPFGREQKGRSHVYVMKDRPGYLRRHGKADPKMPGKTYMGTLAVDDTQQFNPWLEMAFWAPSDKEKSVESVEVDDDAKTDDKVLGTVSAVIATGHPATVTRVRAMARLGNTRTADALTRLVLAGRLTEEEGRRGARIFTPTTPEDTP